MTASPAGEPTGVNEDLFYWRGQVKGRRRQLLKDGTLWLALALGTLCLLLSSHVPIQNLKIVDVATAALSYASIAFGACITSIVLVVSLAPVERVKEWSSKGATGSKYSHYSDLVFVLTWSAIAQLGVIGLGLGSFIFGGETVVVPEDPWLSHRALLWVCSVVAFYAFSQLFTVVSTLSQIAVVTIHESLNERADPALPGSHESK